MLTSIVRKVVFGAFVLFVPIQISTAHAATAVADQCAMNYQNKEATKAEYCNCCVANIIETFDPTQQSCNTFYWQNGNANPITGACAASCEIAGNTFGLSVFQTVWVTCLQVWDQTKKAALSPEPNTPVAPAPGKTIDIPGEPLQSPTPGEPFNRIPGTIRGPGL